MRKSNTKVVKRNQKVASLRGDAWKSNLKKGWLESQMHPTKLKLIRVSKGLSQDSLAKKAEISLSTYSGIERGKRPVGKKTIETITKSLGVSVNKLFKEVAKNRFKAI